MKNVDDKNPRKFDYVLGQILNININEIKKHHFDINLLNKKTTTNK